MAGKNAFFFLRFKAHRACEFCGRQIVGSYECLWCGFDNCRHSSNDLIHPAEHLVGGCKNAMSSGFKKLLKCKKRYKCLNCGKKLVRKKKWCHNCVMLMNADNQARAYIERNKSC